MNGTVLKLVLTPVPIGAASLAGRRWGAAVSGRLVGLPLTSGPIPFFLALSHGATFAAAVAAGTLAGTISQAAFCLAYCWASVRQGWIVALTIGCSAFAFSTVFLRFVALPLAVLALLVGATLAAALRLLPRGSETSRID